MVAGRPPGAPDEEAAPLQRLCMGHTHAHAFPHAHTHVPSRCRESPAQPRPRQDAPCPFLRAPLRTAPARSTNPTQAAPPPCLTSRLPPLPEPKGVPSPRQEGRPGRGQQRQLPPTAPLQLLLETFWQEGRCGEMEPRGRTVATGGQLAVRFPPGGSGAPALVSDTSGLPQGSWSSGFLPRSQGQRGGDTYPRGHCSPLKGPVTKGQQGEPQVNWGKCSRRESVPATREPAPGPQKHALGRWGGRNVHR